MKIKVSDFRIPADGKVKLSKWPTKIKDYYDSKKDYNSALESDVKELQGLQELLYASDKHSVLIIFQGMDTAGKDGAISHVMSGINPQGCQVFSFKQPSAGELEHDFLWRSTKCLPERGRIGIFNRSYYEEVLVVKVHPEILAGQHLPTDILQDHDIWKGRYKSIVEFEDHLARNGTVVVKIFLHLSKDEQKARFIDRIDQPEKNWKFSAADAKERALWDSYSRAYEECLESTSTKTSPWYAVPADDKKNARLIVSAILIEKLKSFDMAFPEVSAERKAELEVIRKQLVAE